MVEDMLVLLTIVSALGSGLIGGVFFAFSTFVMKALGRLPAAQGIAGMQSINIVVINPWFLGAFLGVGAVCLGLGVLSLVAWDRPGTGHLLAGSVLYLVGTLGVTMVCNVPRNDALAAADPASSAGAALWAGYLKSWTAWNHVRTVAALSASAVNTIALCALCHAEHA